MTFTAIARDSRTGELGVGIATYSLAVGASCPFVRPGVAAVSSQAYTNPDLGPAMLDMIEEGHEPQAGFVRLARMDSANFPYRQVGVITASGEVGVHTGRKCRSWCGHIAGEGFAVFGNVLASEAVVQSMAHAMASHVDLPIGERLLVALEAGRDSGGQMGSAGTRLTERSACLLVCGDGPRPSLDLRVDCSEKAVDDLRTAYDTYTPYIPYYEWRQRDPAEAPAQDDWARRIARQG